MAELLDIVKLDDGQTGTVVEVFMDGVLVEIADEQGQTLELRSVERRAEDG